MKLPLPHRARRRRRRGRKEREPSTVQLARGCSQHCVTQARGTPEVPASRGSTETILRGFWLLLYGGKETLPAWLHHTSNRAESTLCLFAIKIRV